MNCEYADYDLLKEEAQATPSWQGAPSASRLPSWGNENHGVILIEGTVSVHAYKGSNIARFITYGSQRWGGGGGGDAMSCPRRKGSLLSQVTREQETDSRVASTYYF